MQPEELQRENWAKMRRVDPTLNLAADGFDRFSEVTTARDTSKVSVTELLCPKYLQLVHRNWRFLSLYADSRSLNNDVLQQLFLYFTVNNSACGLSLCTALQSIC